MIVRWKIVLPALLTVALFILFWREILAAAGALVCLHILRRSTTRHRGRRSGIAQIVTAATSAYTAWNSRWLEPSRFTARVPKGAGGSWVEPDGTVGLSEDYKGRSR